MTSESTNDTAARIQDLAIESTQAIIDAAYLAQRQSAQLLQAWLNNLDAGQAAQRELAQKLVRQSQEAQTLLQQYVKQTYTSGVDAVKEAGQQATEQVREATR